MVESYSVQRKKLVEKMKKEKTIRTPEVENAFLAIPREHFFPSVDRLFAYQDDAFPIGYGQTISQPSTIAEMLELLEVKPGMRVLEIGSGSGYVLGLLSCLTREKNTVYGIERITALTQKSRLALEKTHLDDVAIQVGNGRDGRKEKAPFDRIIISAASEKVPHALVEQLAENGKLVAPLGETQMRERVVFTKKNGALVPAEKKGTYSFVPLQA